MTLSFAETYRKSICRYKYNIDRIANKYVKAAAVNNVVFRVRTMKVEFESTLDELTEENYRNAEQTSLAILKENQFGNAHISAPSLADLPVEHAKLCRRLNNDFEKKYANNAFKAIPLTDVTNFLPLACIRRKKKVKKDAIGRMRQVELTEQHRIIDYRIHKTGHLVRRLTKLDKKLIIKCSKVPERPLTGSGNLFFRMYLNSDQESIRSGVVGLSFFKPAVQSSLPKRLRGLKMLALPAVDDKIRGMLDFPSTSRAIQKGNINKKMTKRVAERRIHGEVVEDGEDWYDRVSRWQQDVVRRTKSKDFEEDLTTEMFDRHYRQKLCRARRSNELMERGCVFD
uniref:Uncharacterized protein n=1 Tax=Parascaris univalens TaxID=6257 RepID=A0A915CKA5_PARUN